MDLEQISKVIFYPCKGLVLKHQVIFGSKRSSDQSRLSPFFKYAYDSQKYSNVGKLEGISVNTSDYLVLESTDYESDNKILLSYPHISRLKRVLKNVMKWFYEDEFEDIFLIKDSELILNDKYFETQEEAVSLVGNKTIVVKPKIVEIQEELYEGCIMYLGSVSMTVEFTVDQIENLYEVIDSFNLYSSSLSLIQTATQLTEMPAYGGTGGKSNNNRSNNSRGRNSGMRKRSSGTDEKEIIDEV